MANETFIIPNVTAMYPKLDKTYRYDEKRVRKVVGSNARPPMRAQYIR